MTTESVSIPTFDQFCQNLNPESPNLSRKLICFDPGETTGVAVFNNGHLITHDQLRTKDLVSGTKAVNEFLAAHINTDYDDQEVRNDVYLVIEDYRVYGWKSDDHAWAELHTAKFIGSLVTLSVMYGVGFSMQMAHQAKQFVTDDKLKAWGMYRSGVKHARDAIRHGVYHTLFNKEHILKN